MCARYAVHAEWNEFGSSKAASYGASFGLSVTLAPMSSSTSGTSEKSGAIAGRAATVIAASGIARRRSAIAGSAMTASPSQFGATISIRFTIVDSLGIALGSRKHARRSRARRRAVSPAAVHPEPEVRMAPHVHFEYVGAPLCEFPHCGL